MRGRTLLLMALMTFATAGPALAHFHTFWPDTHSGYGMPGERIAWQYFWGHPYEMILFDALKPNVYVVTPEGKKQPLALQPATMLDPETSRTRRTYTFAYEPATVGDSWLVLEAPPYPIEEEGEAVQDYVKQCVHVMAQKGWDRRLGLPIELVPLTMPYGLEAGFCFKARAYLDGRPLADATVEIEKFNGFHVREDALPVDEFGMENVPMVTRVAKTDANGYVTCTLDEPGWWMVSVSAESGTVTVDGTEYPRVLRGGLWVPVEKPFTVQP